MGQIGARACGRVKCVRCSRTVLAFHAGTAKEVAEEAAKRSAHLERVHCSLRQSRRAGGRLPP
eukprot:2615868-Rhodomonas_salina.3